MKAQRHNRTLPPGTHVFVTPEEARTIADLLFEHAVDLNERLTVQGGRGVDLAEQIDATQTLRDRFKEACGF